jgi:hypothetical protein
MSKTMTMTQEQLHALMQYVRAVASREAVLAADGSSEGGYDRAELSCEDKLRRLFLVDEPQWPNV